MLNLHGRRMDNSFVADAKTVADSRTHFTDDGPQHLRVSLGGAAPPASSFLYYDFPDSVPGEDEEEDYGDISVDVVAAHTDSVLLRLGDKHYLSATFEDNDFFVYRAGAAGPPSLSLLPDRDFLTKVESNHAKYVLRPAVRPALWSGSTGLLRRGENENDLLVVEVDQWYDREAQQEMLEFCVLRTGTSTGTGTGTGTDMPQWELMEPVPILLDNNEVAPRLSSGNAIIPVGDRYLCWVDYENGFFLCDMADEASPKVRYVPVPAEVSRCCSSDDYVRDYNQHDDVFRLKYSLKMGSVGASKVRFVSVSPHCCCGGPGRSTCAHSRFAFTVTTWTMDLSMDMESPLTWVKDGEVDCEEIWALPGYEGLPRANLECPMVSLEDPNVVCFLVSNNRYFTTYEDRKVWMIQLNINTKTLLSVVQFSNDHWNAYYHLPAQLQY
ncbi:hypothetical protein SORBI_3005G058000 [Sorghum bicolor]|uniref:DUF1618 domain-containing protein n=1 Tax=Sorghum bicolor TaxID=4558 RepID=A0A1Z5RGY0_SORBI|nr:hypothetical protein SORBI_3005G058000 [Sorghum bicolor]